MEKWEYLMLEVGTEWPNPAWEVWPIDPNGNIQKQSASPAPAALNQYGAQGWELVGIGNGPSPSGTGYPIMIFKRRMP